MSKPTPESVIAAVRSMGSDACDLRDAAHEAYHAIRGGLRSGRWDRETIHRAVIRLEPADIACHELGARAVEQIVCARIGVDCGTVDSWAHVAWMEAFKSGVLMFPEGSWIADRVRERMTRPRFQRAADEILALRPRRQRGSR